ncbi:structural maintenance of chromosomes protein 5 [Cydia pomonella]|uniref:structural maintenance of chromosomes protein 5 n=1 Tax=Cydia pomonella TaxID=82600 RepID=UPI002ADD6812|nr:structural maintenance of chromosomes protein 5 [Cydia pomonella]
MPKKAHNKAAKAGSIYRIALQNFVTYKEVELFPGPSLNLIIGPNGTGKSTFVCAIILGLCGKTSVIGRAKKISEYVRSGCQEATIEIELHREPNEPNVIITRTFNLQDASTWKINNKTVREKQVQELISTMNIQVDNLCQLLPQDRVQDFSKMNAQELLRSTLAAVGGHISVEQLDELIRTRSEQRGLSTRLQNNAQLLEEKIRQNERLKIIIEAMQQRKEIEQEILMCERKKYWIEYQELREKVNEYKGDKEKALKLVEIHSKKLEPLEKAFNKVKSGIGKLEQQKLNAAREVRVLKDKLKETIESVKAQEFTLRDKYSSLMEKVERHKNRERELGEARAKLDKLITDKRKFDEEINEDGVKMELAQLHKKIAKENASIDAIKKQHMEMQFQLESNVTPVIRHHQNKIRSLENVDEKRLEVLKHASEHTYKAVMWLRENRAMFKKKVYEPMILEINFTDSKFARYLEAKVASRDLFAFTFECSQDMNRFTNIVRMEHGLRTVNAVSSEGYPALSHYRAQQKDIGQLSYLGFYTYLLDTITAPDPILRYLCGNYNIQSIPIGNDHTFNNCSKVPSNIKSFFTENHRINISVSRYSGVKSSSTVEIGPARLLANTVDKDELDNHKTQLSELENRAKNMKAKMQDLQNKVTNLEGKLNDLNMQRKKITENTDKLKALSTQIRLQEKKVQDIENEPTFNLQEEKEKCRREQRNVVKKQCKMHQELVAIMKKLQDKLLNGEMWKLKLDISRKATESQESQLRELEIALREAKHTLEDMEARYKQTNMKAHAKLKEAKKACSSEFLPQHPSFPFKEQFSELPAELDRLQEHCYELQTRMDCMDKGDEQVIKEYEEREKEIAKLKTDVSSNSDVHKELESKMNSIREKWLPPLENLLRDIDKSFGEMFAKLGCAGEIKLDKAGSDEDYDKYGISILVRFRTSEQLQQLTRHAQSGGERALSTAMYLMSLQRLTTVPFRCVDEINQGMDPINERKMFHLLVKVTTECDNAQYFLLTPKLLTNLEYNPKIMVHTIMNGKQIMNYKQWNYQDFLKNARSYRSTKS